MDHQHVSPTGQVEVAPRALDYLLSLSSTPLCIVTDNEIRAANLPFQDVIGSSEPLVGEPIESICDLPELDSSSGPIELTIRIQNSGKWLEAPVQLRPMATHDGWIIELRTDAIGDGSVPIGSHATRLRHIGELAAGVAHDANNALTTVIGRLLRIKARGHLPSNLRSDLDIIEAASRHAALILQRIQTLSRPEAESALELVPLAELVEEVAQFVDSQLPSRVLLDIDIAHTPDTLASRHELLEVVLNLTRNAIDAVATDGGLVTLRVSLEDDQPVLEVADTGPGIPNEIREQIFTPFFSTKGAGGTGLGLSVSRQLLKQIGASIELDQASDKGSTFRVLFKPNTTQRAPASRTISRRHLRVLVVDDDDNVGALLEELLRAEEHEVTRASSGAEALSIVRNTTLDLVLTDLDLPETHGLELAQELRAIHPTAVIGLVTGWPLSLEERSRATEVVDFVLGKPFTLAELKLTLGRVQTITQDEA